MKKVKVLTILVLIFGTLNNLSAQAYLAYNTSDNNKKEASANVTSENKYNWEFLSATPKSFEGQSMENVSEHDFGKRVACLKKIMEESYITKEDVIPGDPMMRTIVLKPNIYYSTRKVEKYLKQRVKDKSIKLADARKEMEHVLEVALAIIDEEETNTFETTISKNKNNVEKQIEVFRQVKLYNIYL